MAKSKNFSIFVAAIFLGVTPVCGATLEVLTAELDALNSEISKLEEEHEKKLADLQDCEKKNQNFKIAGIATLAGTGVGVAGNVILHKKYANKDGGVGGSFAVADSNLTGADLKPAKADACDSVCANGLKELIKKHNCDC
ncbi:MAG: hypothetical protein K5912_00045 [Alphaproteobacteria bacterium]|nr:hypothetical protein [Alphaproteobacteria bacterium]